MIILTGLFGDQLPWHGRVHSRRHPQNNRRRIRDKLETDVAVRGIDHASERNRVGDIMAENEATLPSHGAD